MGQNEIARLLFLLATLPFIALGLGHIALTLRDLTNPRTFTPVNDQVRQFMTETTLKLTNQTSMWRAWLGFNLSHGVGAVFFGLVLLLIAVYDFEIVLKFQPFMLLAVFISVVYFLLAIKFWFRVPAIGIAIGGTLFMLSYAVVLVS